MSKEEGDGGTDGGESRHASVKRIKYNKRLIKEKSCSVGSEVGRSVDVCGVGRTCRCMDNKCPLDGELHTSAESVSPHIPKVSLLETPSLYLFSLKTEFSPLTPLFLCKRPSLTSASCAVALRAPARSEPTRRLVPPRVSHAGPPHWAGLKALVVSHKRAGSPDPISPLLFMICE